MSSSKSAQTHHSVNNTDELVKIGQLKKPYGIKGWLWIFSDLEDRDTIFDMQPWWIKTATGMKTLTVTNWRHQGAGLVAQFGEIADRTIAETMQGVSIWTTKDNLLAAEDDEYFWSDLVGLAVYNQQDEYLGDIKEMFETGAHDIMVVQPTQDSFDDEKRLIPWHKHTVISVDLPSKQVIVDWLNDY